MDENTKRTFWIVISYKGIKEVIEVQDVMYTLSGPGDLGWVRPVNGLAISWIVHFEEVSNTREEAIQKHTNYLREELSKARLALFLWKQDQGIHELESHINGIGKKPDEAFADQFYKHGRPRDQFYLFRDPTCEISTEELG